MKPLLLLCLATAAAAQIPGIFPLEGATPAAVATDPQGNIYIAGQTYSTKFPVTANALQSQLTGSSGAFVTNAFIAKFSPAGDLLWSTYFGSSSTQAWGLAIDSAGNILVAGATSAPYLPVVNAYQSTPGGATDAFALQLDPAGKLLYCTYLGGAGNDSATSLAVDSTGAAYIAGVTGSANFPGQTAIAYPVEAFVVKLAASGALVYSWESTEEDTAPVAITVDSGGSAYIAGSLPTTPAGRNQSFVRKLSPSGSQVVYQAHFGGSQLNNPSTIAVDSTGAAYIAGATTSVDFPVVNPYQSTLGSRPLWKSIDGGNTWTPLDNLPFAVLQALAAAPSAPHTLYAGASDTGIFSSTNGGITWTAIDNGIADPVPGLLALDPSNPLGLYVGVGNQVYRSVDGGANWTLADSLAATVTEIAVDPQQPSHVYAISQSAAAKSTDGGVSWNALPPAYPGIASLLVDPVAEGTLYAYSGPFAIDLFNSQSYIYRSTDGGNSWTTLNDISPYPPGLFADPTTTPATIYAGAYARSSNSGSTWTNLTPPPGLAVPAAPSAMAVDPRNGAIYAAGYPAGGTPLSLDISTNRGQSWTQLSVPSQMPAITGITPTPDALYAANNYIQGSAFVVKLSPDGSTILYSTYLRGHGGTPAGQTPWSNHAWGIALDAAGNMVVVGGTQALDFPTLDAPQPANAGLTDAFVAVISADGQRTVYSTYLGGAMTDEATAVAVDPQGNLIVAGETLSTAILGTAIPLDPAIANTVQNTGFSGFVARLAVPAPAISAVLNAASYQPGIEAGSWVMIQGASLADSTRAWQSSDFAGNALPAALDGVSVTIDGEPASVEYISPTQVNVQAPSDSATGLVNVIVTNNGHSSAPATAQLQAIAPALFMTPAYNAIASVLPGYSPVTAASPAMPGDLVVLWGTGFGPTNPPAPAGAVVTGAPATSTLPVVTVGGVQVQVVSSVLTAGTAGLYQIAIQLPANLPTGTVGVQASIGGVATQAGVKLFVGAQ